MSQIQKILSASMNLEKRSSYQARVQGGGPKSLPPPLEIEKPKKKGHQSKF